MKRMYSLMIIILSACLIFSQAAYAQNVSSKTKIIVNGKNLETDKNIQVIDKCVYVPLSDTLKSLGYIVEYDAKYKLVRAKKDKNTIVIQTSDKSAKVNGKTVQMGEKPLSVKGSIFVPLDFIKESTGADTTWNANTFTVDINQKNDLNDTQVSNISEDQKVADRLSGLINKTSEELLKLKSGLSNWQNVIIEVVSEQKNIDKSMVKKFRGYFGYDDETILKMKYKLGNWIDVFGYLIIEKEPNKGISSGVTLDGNMSASYLQQLIDDAKIRSTVDMLTPLCSKRPIVYTNNRDKFQEALQNVEIKIDFLEAAKCIGMPENIIKDLKENKKLYDYEIYIKARRTWAYGGSYKDETTGTITQFHSRSLDAIDINDVTLNDPIDNVIKSELNIKEDMIKKCSENGISDIVSIAKLHIWDINDTNDIKEFSILTEKYSLSMDELNKMRMDYMSWQQIEDVLNENNDRNTNSK